MSENQSKAHHVIWQPPGAPALLGDPIIQCLILVILTSAIFVAFPGIDIWFSNLFYNRGFLAGQLRGFIAFRDIWRSMTVVIVVVLVAVPLVKIAWPYRRSLLKPNDIAFILSTLVIGPGIITNLIFKDNWGRPRPVSVVNYGGHLPFVDAWQITDYCARNCSFISGEGSSATWLVTMAVLLPPRFRMIGFTILAAFGVAFSLDRVVIGAHFLSDTLLAWWVTLLVIVIEYRVFYVDPPSALTNNSMEARLTEFGIMLHRAPVSLWRKVITRRDRTSS